MARTHTRTQRIKPGGAMSHYWTPALLAAFVACGSGDSPSVSAQPTAEQETTGYAEAQPTADREVIEEPVSTMPRFGVFGTAKVEFVFVSAVSRYTRGVTLNGSVACWGEQARGLTALPGG